MTGKMMIIELTDLIKKWALGANLRNIHQINLAGNIHGLARVFSLSYKKKSSNIIKVLQLSLTIIQICVLLALIQSSPFDACDRTCTHQHTHH